MNLLEHIVARAKSNKQRIVLPEATEERTLKAADRVLADDLADLILIGNPDRVAPGNCQEQVPEDSDNRDVQSYNGATSH